VPVVTLWGRTLGVLSTAGAILLWFVFVFFNPYTGAGLDTGTMVVVFLMVMLASTGLAASLLSRPWLLLAAAVISFVPVGLYTLGVPGMFRWIGALNLMTLAGAALLVDDRRRNRAV
jgi:hypothetical protein